MPLAVDNTLIFWLLIAILVLMIIPESARWIVVIIVIILLILFVPWGSVLPGLGKPAPRPVAY